MYGYERIILGWTLNHWEDLNFRISTWIYKSIQFFMISYLNTTNALIFFTGRPQLSLTLYIKRKRKKSCKIFWYWKYREVNVNKYPHLLNFQFMFLPQIVSLNGIIINRPRGKESTQVRKSQIKGKESENSYQTLKRSPRDRH